MALSPVALRASTSAASADRSAFTRSNSPALMAANRSVSLDSFMRRFYLLLRLLRVAILARSERHTERECQGNLDRRVPREDITVRVVLDADLGIEPS